MTGIATWVSAGLAGAGLLLVAGLAPAQAPGHGAVEGPVVMTWTPGSGGWMQQPIAPQPTWEDRLRIEEARVEDTKWQVEQAAANTQRMALGLVEPAVGEVQLRQRLTEEARLGLADLRASHAQLAQVLALAGPGEARVPGLEAAAALAALGLAGVGALRRRA